MKSSCELAQAKAESAPKRDFVLLVHSNDVRTRPCIYHRYDPPSLPRVLRTFTSIDSLIHATWLPHQGSMLKDQISPDAEDLITGRVSLRNRALASPRGILSKCTLSCLRVAPSRASTWHPLVPPRVTLSCLHT